MRISKCQFHKDSTAVEVDGEIHQISCKKCGDYRISNMALSELKARKRAPKGWQDMVNRRPLVSTRDTRTLLTA